MDDHRKELSLKFYSFLCDVIGTKQVVNKRRQIFSVKEDCSRVRGILTVSSGSKAEGVDLKGSDFDQMVVVPVVQVVEHVKKLDHVKDSDRISLIMDTENVKTGFTKLWVYHLPSNRPGMLDLIDWRKGRPYLSKTLYLQGMYQSVQMMFPDDRFYIHGPCTTSPDGMIDQALSLHCADWISQALPWITRTKYSWASDEVIRKILCSGVLFVPIGSKMSPNTDLEWRISFSYAEKLLIFCFNHVQLLCYALLKIILKDIIKKSFGDLLCSYFMKTIIFWLCEETDVAFWRKENILLCFMTCLRRLIYCVENETCLHYFIPENNLFENKFQKQHHDLLAKLSGLYDLGWTCLLQTETLQSFIGYPESSSTRSLSTFFPCLEFIDCAYFDIADDAALIKRCIFQSIRSKKKRDIYMYSLSRMCQCFAQKSCYEKSVQGNNKQYRNLRRRLSHLYIGLNHDAVSGWLLLASFLFTNKQYIISKILIDYSLSKFTPERCELFRENNLWQLRRYLKVQNIIGQKCLKNYTISEVKTWKGAFMSRCELGFSAMNDSFIYSTSIVYAHALNFLFNHTVGAYREAATSLRAIKFYRERYNQYAHTG